MCRKFIVSQPVNKNKAIFGEWGCICNKRERYKTVPRDAVNFIYPPCQSLWLCLPPFRQGGQYGLPHQCEHWFAMTSFWISVSFRRFIYILRNGQDVHYKGTQSVSALPPPDGGGAEQREAEGENDYPSVASRQPSPLVFCLKICHRHVFLTAKVLTRGAMMSRKYLLCTD